MRWYFIMVLIRISLMTSGVDHLFMWAVDFCKLQSGWGRLNPKPGEREAENQFHLYYISSPQTWKLVVQVPVSFKTPDVLSRSIEHGDYLSLLWKKAGDFFCGENKPQALWKVGIPYRQQIIEHIHTGFWDTPVSPLPAQCSLLIWLLILVFTQKQGLGRHWLSKSWKNFLYKFLKGQITV